VIFDKSFNWFARFWALTLSRFSWLIVALALVASGLSIYITVHRLSFQTKQLDLISSNQRLTALQAHLDKEFGSKDGLVVVVASPEKRRAIAFAEALAQELRRYPQDFPEIFYRVDPQAFKDRALYFLDLKEERELRDKILSNQGIMKELAANPSLTQFFSSVNHEVTRSMLGQLFTGFLQEENQGNLPDLSLLNNTLRQLSQSLEGQNKYNSPFKALFPKGLGDLEDEGYFFTNNNQYLLFLVTSKPGDYHDSQETLDHLRQVLSQLKPKFPGIQVGVTGPEALQDDEMASGQKDIALATWLSLLGQFFLLVIFFRSLKRPLVEVAALLIGLCWAFGLTTLVIGHLNILSMIFAPLMLGIAIDFGIHWFCRLEEEQGDNRCSLTSLYYTQKFGGPGIAYAVVASALCFLPLAFTGFKGLAELGLILFMGLMTMIVVTLVVQPAMVKLAERCPPVAQLETGRHEPPHPFIFLRWQRPGVIAVLGLALMAVAIVALFNVHFNLNPLDLQNPKTESVVWELKLLKGSHYSSTYAIMTAKSLPEVEAKARALKGLTSVSHVESILSFLPEDSAAKRRVIKEIGAAVAPLSFAPRPAQVSTPSEVAAILQRLQFKLDAAQQSDWDPDRKAEKEQVGEATTLLSRLQALLNPAKNPLAAVRLAAFDKKFFADLKDKWQLLKENVSAQPLQLTDLPSKVRSRFVSPQGTYIIKVFPAHDIWQFPVLQRFVQDLRHIDPNVVGDPVLLYVFNSAFVKDCLWATGIGLMAIICLALPLYRSLTVSLMTLIPLFFGLSLTLNLMWLLGITFNQANVIALPLLLGESVEFGIIILTRWQLERSARALTLPASTAKGVALAALTTTVGFGSLMVSGQWGVFSLGLLATIGSLSVLVGTLIFLPALLRLWEKRQIIWAAVLKPLEVRNPGALKKREKFGSGPMQENSRRPGPRESSG
jgi:hopanoid biosynthesis associated RND transporter like protein HpnN